jgi:hypothetical protein
MGLKDIDIGAVLRGLAEKRIEEAIEAGKFDNLRGAGEPQYLEPLAADEDARAMWWALRILRNADVQTDEIRYRRQVAALRTRIALTRQAAEMSCLVREHNEVVRKLNTMGTNVIRTCPGPLDEAAELARLGES